MLISQLQEWRHGDMSGINSAYRTLPTLSEKTAHPIVYTPPKNQLSDTCSINQLTFGGC